MTPPRTRRLRAEPFVDLQDSARRRTLLRDSGFRGAAHPVVEIEEHRRALRGRLQQLAEAAEHMRANRVALVLADVDLGAPLACEDVEVVEPEIDEHLFELPVAVDGAEQLGLGQLGEDLPLAPDGVAHPGAERRAVHWRRHRGRSRGLRPGLRVAAVGVRLLPLPPLLPRRREVVARDRLRIQRQRRQRGEPSIEVVVGNPLRLQLAVDPRRKTRPGDPIDVAGTCTEGEPVENVCNRPFVTGDGRQSGRGRTLGERPSDDPGKDEKAADGWSKRSHALTSVHRRPGRHRGLIQTVTTALDPAGLRRVESRYSAPPAGQAGEAELRS